jgi:hypothetical protein
MNLVNIITEIFAKVKDGEGNVITSTALTGGKRALDVNVTGTVSQQISGISLLYDLMTINQALTNGSYKAVYNLNGSGIIRKAHLMFSSTNINIRLTVDGTVILNGLLLSEAWVDYKLTPTDVPYTNFINLFNTGNGIVFDYGYSGLSYSSNFKIEAKANSGNLRLNRGLAVRT